MNKTRTMITVAVFCASLSYSACNVFAEDVEPQPFSAVETVEMVKDMLHGYEIPESFVDNAFSQAADPATLTKITQLFAKSKPKLVTATETPKPPAPNPNVISDVYVSSGVTFVKAHYEELKAAEDKYGVDYLLLAALIGVETRFGTYTGDFVIFDALNTVAQTVGRKSMWAAREIEELLEFSYAQGIDPRSLKGSYAGAFGFVQFLPSSYNAFAQDADGDGKPNLFSWKDAIMSCANYLKEAGYSGNDFTWAPPYQGYPLFKNSEVPVDAPEAPAIGKSVYHYNHDHKYVMSILALREKIKQQL